jgi:hypothetical protein
MKRLTRLAVGALTAAVMVGTVSATGAAASASPGHRQGHHHSVALDGSPHVLIALGRLDRRLGGALHRLTPLPDVDATILRSNAVADRSTVESVATKYSSAPTRRHLSAAIRLLRAFHPERYVAATTILRRSARTTAKIAQLRAQVAPDTTAASELAAASRFLRSVRARHFTARTDREAMHNARLEVRIARGIVARVAADLAGR